MDVWRGNVDTWRGDVDIWRGNVDARLKTMEDFYLGQRHGGEGSSGGGGDNVQP